MEELSNKQELLKERKIVSMRQVTGWKLKNKEGFQLPLQYYNLITPGHQDFSEDTYRTLMAADCAVMVIDASKGVEDQTRKLFKVCTMRHIPIFTFINKMDREARDPYELMEEIEQELGIETCPVNWPIGSGKRFAGVYERNDQEVIRFIPVDGGKKEVETEILKADDPKLKEYVEDELYDKLQEDIELLEKHHVNAVLIGEAMMKSHDKRHTLEVLKGIDEED